MFDSSHEVRTLFGQLDLSVAMASGDLVSHSPIDGKVIGQLASARREEVEAAIGRAHDAFLAWRTVPAPRRGELVRLFGQVLREGKEPLARLVSLETGKIIAEALGEVQEMRSEEPTSELQSLMRTSYAVL